MNDVASTLAYLFQQCFSVVDRIYSGTNTWGIVLSAFFVFTLYRFLLGPILGSYISAAASDKVRKMRKTSKIKKSNKNNKERN